MSDMKRIGGNPAPEVMQHGTPAESRAQLRRALPSVLIELLDTRDEAKAEGGLRRTLERRALQRAEEARVARTVIG